MSEDHAEGEQPKPRFEGGIPILPTAIDIAKAEEEAKKNAEKTYRDRQIELDGRMVVFTGLLFFCTLITAFINGAQVVVANRNAKAAETAADAAADAAYEACRGVQVSRTSLMEAQKGANETYQSATAAVYQALAATQSEAADLTMTYKPVIKVGQPIAIIFGLKNEGRTAAIDVHVKVRTEFIARNAMPEFTYPKDKIVSLSARVSPGETIPIPENKIIADAFLSNNDRPIASSSDVSDYEQGRKDFIFYSHFTFSDIFGVRHETTYCASDAMTKESFPMEIPRRDCAKYNRNDTNTALKPLPPISPSDSLPEIVCTAPKAP